MRIWIVLFLGIAAIPASAETLVAARTLRAQTIVTPDDVLTQSGTVPGVLTDATEAIGLETRVAIYQGRPIRPADLGPPAIVDRNQIVALSYVAGALTITAEGRALARGGVGDRIRVMNVASRTTVSGVVAAGGSVRVMAER
ncbi:flagellar basal body P-ring formation chaperone FlgA [Defluviimonas sp. WL0024]|uniref:Flagella basal body P-ring formation protein FlgA n=1 Tax=Albidovulum salinarum TaxID=2984153 RepID=A0ABT2X686_9RHOB|nr:flagellar basal body P-ring formation chaperone FlgA [Defluviimonas sp. WL0024]MCU9849465.1 flagellar basal body P-ring formation chaperone FlgA [Defluviimonas sp. WL0024]